MIAGAERRARRDRFGRWIDRTSNTTGGTVRIDGVGILEIGPVSFTPLAGESPTLVVQGVVINLGAPAFTVDVDMTSYEIFDEIRPLALAYYVDVGSAEGTPDDTYGAVIPVGGIWETIGLGTSPLDQATGAPSPATATLTASFDNGSGPGAVGDPRALMGDHAGDCSSFDWTLAFDDLPNGYYVVYVYAPSDPDTATGVISVPQGSGLLEMPGTSSASVVSGTSYGRIEAFVSDGSLDLEGLGTGATLCAGIAGVQLLLRIDPTPAVPGLGVWGAGVLGAMLIGVGARKAREHAARLRRSR